MSTSEIFIACLEKRVVRLLKLSKALISAIEKGGDIEKAKNELKIEVENAI